MPCIVTYNGKEYSEAEFFAFLAKGELQNLIDKGLYVPKQQTSETEPKLQGAEPPKQKRRFGQQVVNSYPELKKLISEDGLFYNRLPNQEALSEADALLNYLGMDEAKRAYMDFSNSMNGAVRTVLGMALIKRYESDGDYDSAIEVIEAMSIRGTDLGREIQAMSMFSVLTAEGQIRLAAKTVEKSKETKKKRAKKRVGKIAKALEKVNKESVEKVLSLGTIEEKISAVDKITPKETTEKKDYGSTNKIVTKDRYNELKKALKGKLFSNIPPELIEIGIYHIEAGSRSFVDFSKKMIDEFGKKVNPYLKTIYEGARDKMTKEKVNIEGLSSEVEVDNILLEAKFEDAIKQVEKQIKVKSRKALKQAMTMLSEIGSQSGLWGKYKDFAVNRLKNTPLSFIEQDVNDSPALQEFTQYLIQNIKQQIDESQPKSESKPVKVDKPAIEIISDAFKNFEKYQEVWQAAYNNMVENNKSNEAVLQELDNYFGQLMPKPFSQKMITKALKQEMKKQGVDIRKVIKEHYTIYDYTKRNLVDKLISDSGLSEGEAKTLAEAIEAEFDKIATQAKQKAIDKYLTKAEKKSQEKRGLEEDLLRLTNLGAFDSEEILEAWAEKMGYPKLTEANIKEIRRLSNAVQEAQEGFKKFRAIEDLLSYQANLKGVEATEVFTAVWYANLLSNHNTQMVNFISTAINASMGLTNAILQNPLQAKFIAKGFMIGLSRGMLEGYETLRTGYSPIRGKVEIPPVLERVYFTGKSYPLNALKYVGRLMKASDVILFQAAKEMRSYQLAVKLAAKDENMLTPNQTLLDKAAEIVGSSSNVWEEAYAQSELEYEQELEDINSSTMTDEEKNMARKQASRDKKRRVYEIIEEDRSDDIVSSSSEYAARATYNYKPEGLLGLMASQMNQFKDALARTASEQDNAVLAGAAKTVKVLTDFIIPFTNIIANVANEQLNYTPFGFARAGVGRTSLTGYNSRELKPEEVVDMNIKALMGTSMMIGIYLLTFAMGDDEKPLIEITGGGTGNYGKDYQLMEKGYQKYSIKVGDTWISYQYSPLMLALSFIGNMKDGEKYRGEKLSQQETQAKIANAFQAQSRVLFDMTFLQSLNGFLGALMGERDISVDSIKSALGQAASTIVITGLYTGLFKESQKIFDISNKNIQGEFMGAFLQHIPFARDIYYDRLNALGEPVYPNTNRFISFSKDKPVWDLLAEKEAFITPPVRNRLKTVDIETGKERIYTQKEFYEYSKLRGEYIKNALQVMTDAKQISNAVFAKRLDLIEKQATAVAKIKLNL